MNEKVAKVAKKGLNDYVCDWCDYICCKKSDYTKHLNTAKHKKKIMLNTNEQETLIPQLFMCKNCNNINIIII